MVESVVLSEPAFQSEDRVIYTQIRGLIPFQRARYTSPVVVGNSVFLSCYEDREDGLDDAELPEKLAEGFTFPLVIFQVESPYKFDPVTTPYGDLSKFAVGENGEFHIFYNTYIFDTVGNSKKAELMVTNIASGGNGKMTKALREELGIAQSEAEALEGGMKVLDFEPSEKDERLVDLENGDYEIIHSLLTQIRIDEWVPGFSNPLQDL